MKRKVVKTLPDKIPKRYFTVFDAVFHRRIHILLNHTPQDYAKWLNKVKAEDVSEKEFDDFAGFTSTVSVKDRPTEFLIYIKHFEWTIKDQGTLIHEVVHAIVRIWESNNIPYNTHTQEFLAHSIANLYEDIARKLLVIKHIK